MQDFEEWVANWVVRSFRFVKSETHVELPAGASMILGCNGLIWVAPSTSFATDTEPGPVKSVETAAGASDAQGHSVPLETREAVCRVVNSIRCLGGLNLAVHPSSIMTVYKVYPLSPSSVPLPAPATSHL